MRRPPRARPVAGSLGTSRMADCQPSTRSERAASAFGQASAFLFQRGDPETTRRFGGNAELRRQRGGARIRFARPAGRAGPVYGPFWPIPPRPARPIPRPIPPKSTNIFLEILTFHFPIFTSSRTEYSPSLASLGSPSRRGPAGQRTGAMAAALRTARPLRRRGTKKKGGAPLRTRLPKQVPCGGSYLMILVTVPAPTVRPPSRMAKRIFSSRAAGQMSVTVILMLSPGMTISTPSGSLMSPVMSAVRM